MFADLHLHSMFSDGTYTPQEVVGQASKHGLRAIALTDHDTVEGCGLTATACRAAGLEFIPGVELTAELDDQEFHLLGYCVDIHHPALLRALARFQTVRQNRVREMVARLNDLNISLAAESVFALANCRSPGRPHVARALVQAGFCASVDEAFDRFLKKHRPAWVPKFKISASDAIELVHQAGGLAVLAHPGITNADPLIRPLVEARVDGIECFHTKHSTSTTEYYIMVAEQHGLLVTGGSDCHGMSKGKPLIGSVRLPWTYFNRLTERAAEAQAMLPARNGV